MQINIFTLCDSSQVYDGKMVVMGAMSSFVAKSLPIIIPSMSLAIRLSYQVSEKVSSHYAISILTPSGKVIVKKDINNSDTINPSIKTKTCSNVNFNFIMNNMLLEESGVYSIIFETDGKKYTSNFDVVLLE